MERSDELLIRAHRQGDPTAFDELVRRHGDALFGYLMRMCHNPQQAEDLFQETFKRVHQKADTFQGKGKFKCWLYAIANHIAIDSLRKRSREPQMVSIEKKNDCEGSGCPASPLEFTPGADRGPQQIALLTERKAQVREALDKLSPRQRTTLVLAYYQGLSYKEVAQTLDCSLGTVKSQMFRALKTLAGLLPDMEGDVQ